MLKLNFIPLQKNKIMAKKELRIKELCKERGITQAQLAEKLGIMPVSFSQAIARNKFNIDRLAEIADVFEIEIPDLFAHDEVSLKCPHCGKPISIEIK